MSNFWQKNSFTAKKKLARYKKVNCVHLRVAEALKIQSTFDFKGNPVEQFVCFLDFMTASWAKKTRKNKGGEWKIKV